MLLRLAVRENRTPSKIEDTRKPLTEEETLAALTQASDEAKRPGYRESLIPYNVFIHEMREIANGIQP